MTHEPQIYCKGDIAMTRFEPYGYSRSGAVITLENWCIVTRTIMFIYDLLTNIGSISYLKRVMPMTRFEPYGYSRSGCIMVSTCPPYNV